MRHYCIKYIPIFLFGHFLAFLICFFIFWSFLAGILPYATHMLDKNVFKPNKINITNNIYSILYQILCFLFQNVFVLLPVAQSAPCRRRQEEKETTPTATTTQTTQCRLLPGEVPRGSAHGGGTHVGPKQIIREASAHAEWQPGPGRIADTQVLPICKYFIRQTFWCDLFSMFMV